MGLCGLTSEKAPPAGILPTISFVDRTAFCHEIRVANTRVVRRKIVILGDGACGILSLLLLGVCRKEADRRENEFTECFYTRIFSRSL